MFSNMIFLSTTTLIHDHCPHRQLLLLNLTEPNGLTWIAADDVHGILSCTFKLYGRSQRTTLWSVYFAIP